MKKGDIYLLDLSTGIGHEQYGERPAILLSNLVNGMIVVVPLTSNLKSSRFSHTLSVTPSKKNNLDSKSIALVFQLKAVDSKRIVKHIGQIDSSDCEQLGQILKDLLTLK